MNRILIILFLPLLVFSCQNASDLETKKEKARAAIRQAEKDFEKMVAEKGLEAGFTFYAAKDAVIHRNDSLFIGNQAIASFYARPAKGTIQLKWSPDFTEVASSCDLGYTYGHFTFQSTDSTGHLTTFNGIFHTVWKLQEDGLWKYVWD